MSRQRAPAGTTSFSHRVSTPLSVCCLFGSPVPSLLGGRCHVSLSRLACSLCPSLFPRQQLLSHVCVKVNVSSSLSVEKGQPPFLPPSLPVHSVLLPHQAVALSLSLSATCSLARSLTISRPQQTVCPQTAADSGSAELQGCLLCLSFLRFYCYNCSPSLCVGKQLSMLTRAIQRHSFLFFLSSLVQVTHYKTTDVE